MNNIKRVMSIGAHFLDAELLGGPLVIKYANLGAKCTFVHVTQGRLEDPNATKEENDLYLKKLVSQNENAAKGMSADCNALGYLSRELPTESGFNYNSL